MSGPLRTLVVDDEKLARDRLVGFLARVAGVEVIGQATNGVEAVELIERDRPDLVFLDVQMPGMDGFEVLKALERPRPQVVFATAYDEYAIRAFEVQAVDYLLKPFARARVEEAVGRVRARLEQRRRRPRRRSGAARGSRSAARRTSTQCPCTPASASCCCPSDDVLWFGVEYRLVYAHTGERAYMTNFTLRELEERLDPEVFFRAHKASLVNLRQVKEIVPWFGGRYKLVMRDQAGERGRRSAAPRRARCAPGCAGDGRHTTVA